MLTPLQITGDTKSVADKLAHTSKRNILSRQGSEVFILLYYSLDMAATEGVHVYSQNGSMLFYFGDLGVRGQGQGCLIYVPYTVHCVAGRFFVLFNQKTKQSGLWLKKDF
jgi:hypothetical protein